MTSEVPTPKRNSPSHRVQRMVEVAKLIPIADFVKERSLQETKWFDYRFMSPVEATEIFASEYKLMYKKFWAANFDFDESKRRRGLPLGSILENTKYAIAMWRARQFADEICMPYDLFLRAAFQLWLDNGPQRLPQPNQLYSDKWAENIKFSAWRLLQERIENGPVYPEIPQYQAAALRDVSALRYHLEWMFGVINECKRDVLWVALDRGLISPAWASEKFGHERAEQAGRQPRSREPVDATALTDADFMPSCAFVPHAYDAKASECLACHMRTACGAGQPGVLRKIQRLHGSMDPVSDRKRGQGASRVAACRERKKILAAASARAA